MGSVQPQLVRLPSEGDYVDVLGGARIFDAANALINTVRVLAKQIPNTLTTAQQSIGHGLGWIGLASLTNDVMEFRSWATKGALDKAYLVCGTIVDFVPSLIFFDEIKVTEFGKTFGTIGNLPVLGTIASAANLTFFAISYRKHSIEKREATAKLADVDSRIAAINVRLNDPEQVGFIGDEFEKMQAARESSALKEREIVQIELKQSKVRVIYDIMSIAQSILLVGVFAGAAIFASMGIGILVLGFVVSSVGLAQHFYCRKLDRNILVLEAARNAIEQTISNYQLRATTRLELSGQGVPV